MVKRKNKYNVTPELYNLVQNGGYVIASFNFWKYTQSASGNNFEISDEEYSD